MGQAMREIVCLAVLPRPRRRARQETNAGIASRKSDNQFGRAIVRAAVADEDFPDRGALPEQALEAGSETVHLVQNWDEDDGLAFCLVTIDRIDAAAACRLDQPHRHADREH